MCHPAWTRALAEAHQDRIDREQVRPLDAATPASDAGMSTGQLRTPTGVP
jgi:hypothetical protein